MNMNDAIETITHFFNDLIGNIIPGGVLAVGLSIMHLGTAKIVETSKSLENTALTLTIIGLMYAASHFLIAIFEWAIQPLLRILKIVHRFDDERAKTRKSYSLFAQIVNKLRGVDDHQTKTEWAYLDLRNVALSVSAEGASLGRRFMFTSQLCNGVGTALLIILVDFLGCQAFNQELLVPYVMTINLFVQGLLIFFASVALFKRGEIFYRRAMTTPFSIAVAELKLKRDNNAPE